MIPVKVRPAESEQHMPVYSNHFGHTSPLSAEWCYLNFNERLIFSEIYLPLEVPTDIKTSSDQWT